MKRQDLTGELPQLDRVARGDADHVARRRRARDVVREREADHDVLHHVRRQVDEQLRRHEEGAPVHSCGVCSHQTRELSELVLHPAYIRP